MANKNTSYDALIEEVSNLEETVKYQNILIKKYVAEKSNNSYLYDQQQILLLKDKNKKLTEELKKYKALCNTASFKKRDQEIKALSKNNNELEQKYEKIKAEKVELNKKIKISSMVSENVNKNISKIINQSLLEISAERYVAEFFKRYADQLEKSKDLYFLQTFFDDLIKIFNENAIEHRLNSKKRWFRLFN